MRSGSASHPPTRVAIVCGSGNNGGDGFVVARHLHSSGTTVEVLLTGVASKLSIDARTNLEAAERLGVRITRRPAVTALRAALRRSDVVVDAVFGVGFRGRARGDAAGVIAAINASRRPVVSLDVPSGVDASTGTVEGEAVVAAFTIAFHGPKLGLVVAPGSRHAGAVVVADIGIPTQLERPTHAALATRDLLDRVPPKTSASTKYSAGSVLVVGGAPGYAGAPVLCATAALRAGAGVVWLAVPDEQVAQIEGRQPELMVRPRREGLELASRAGARRARPGPWPVTGGDRAGPAACARAPGIDRDRRGRAVRARRRARADRRPSPPRGVDPARGRDGEAAWARGRLGAVEPAGRRPRGSRDQPRGGAAEGRGHAHCRARRRARRRLGVGRAWPGNGRIRRRADRRDRRHARARPRPVDGGLLRRGGPRARRARRVRGAAAGTGSSAAT